MKTEARILLDSMIDGVRILTFELQFPRFILAQFNTHRSFSRSAASSRAIPNKTLMQSVCYVPANFPINGKGMQPKGHMQGFRNLVATLLGKSAMQCAKLFSRLLSALGVHKEICNRLLEPFMFVRVVMTTGEPGLQNFFQLRCHPDAQGEIEELANLMRVAYNESVPARRELHLPYVDVRETYDYKLYVRDHLPHILALIKQSMARCARVSYLKNGKQSTLEQDIELYEKLVGSRPLHASPAEMCVMSIRLCGWMIGLVEEWKNAELELKNDVYRNVLHGNLPPGVVQYRKILERTVK